MRILKCQHLNTKLGDGNMKQPVSEFDKANQKIHKVEDQWHYPLMTKYKFEPITKEAVGFVRKYITLFSHFTYP